MNLKILCGKENIKKFGKLSDLETFYKKDDLLKTGTIKETEVMSIKTH